MSSDSGNEDDVSMTTVSAQISADKKERWEQAVDEGEDYSSVSDLIRLAVSRMLSDSHSYVHESKRPSSEGEIQLDTDNLLSELDKRFEEVNDRIDRLAATHPSREGRNKSLTNEIIDLVPTLPTMQVAQDWIDQRTDGQGDLLSEYVEPHDDGRPIASSTRLANHLDEDENKVREAMYSIEKGSSRFRTVRDRGETWLFSLGGD